MSTAFGVDSALAYYIGSTRLKLGAILSVFPDWCERYPEWHAPLSPDEEELVAARERIEMVWRALDGEIGTIRGREGDCQRLRVAHSIFCRDHHIANLQRVGALPVISDDGLRVIRPAND